MLHLDDTSGQVFCGKQTKSLASDTFVVNNEDFSHVRVKINVDGHRHDILVPACKLSTLTVITSEISLEIGGSDEEQ